MCVATKDWINQSLSRVTGYHLTKGAPGAERARAAERAHTLRQETAAVRDELKSVKAKLRTTEKELASARRAAKPKQPPFPRDFDPDVRAIIEASRPYTMTSPHKQWVLIEAVKYVSRYKIPGDIVECGVWRGGSMHAAARTLDALGDHSRDLYLYDTFEGMPPPTDVDVRADGQSAAHLLETSDRNAYIWAIASLEEVKAGFVDAKVPYPSERIHFVQGKVEDTIPGVLPETISVLRLDTDWYESTAHELEHMYSRLSPGGVLILDDYGHFEGARKAVDEFIAATGEPLLLLRMAEGRVAVKPGLTRSRSRAK